MANPRLRATRNKEDRTVTINPPPLMIFLALGLMILAYTLPPEVSPLVTALVTMLCFTVLAPIITLVPRGIDPIIGVLAIIAIQATAWREVPEIHLVPLLIVFAAGWYQLSTEERKIPRPSMVVAGICAFVLSIFFNDWTMTPDGGGGGAESDPVESPMSPGEDGTLARIVRWLGRLFGNDGGETRVDGTSVGRPPEPVDWLAILTVLGVLLILTLLGFLIWRSFRSRRGPAVGTPSAALVRRFEAVGSKAGMPRKSSEGLLTYGRELTSTGDERPLATGGLVSAAIYDPSGSATDFAEQSVADLETTPLKPH